MSFSTIRLHTLFACIAGIVLVLTSCETATGEADYVPSGFKRLHALDKTDYRAALNDLSRADAITRLFRDSRYRSSVIDFFTAITKSGIVATGILDQAGNYGVPPALAFALAYEESDFEPRAVNRNADSVDRGLFQLNSKSFPDKSAEYLFDPANNIRYGMAHLAFCLDQGGNDVAALAMYNAGMTRVSKGGTPRRTLDYIFRISSYRDKLEALFEAQIVARTADGGDERVAASSPGTGSGSKSLD